MLRLFPVVAARNSPLNGTRRRFQPKMPVNTAVLLTSARSRLLAQWLCISDTAVYRSEQCICACW